MWRPTKACMDCHKRGTQQTSYSLNAWSPKDISNAHTNKPGLWIQKWHPILLPLVIDNFGVKYVGKEHPNHLIPAITVLFPVAEARNGTLYFGIKLK